MGLFDSKAEKEAKRLLEEKRKDEIRKDNRRRAIEDIKSKIKDLGKPDLIDMRRKTIFEIMSICAAEKFDCDPFALDLSFAEGNIVSSWSIEGPKRVISHKAECRRQGLYLLLEAIDELIKGINEE